MSKLNKKVAVLIACLLLALPATVAQSQSPKTIDPAHYEVLV